MPKSGSFVLLYGVKYRTDWDLTGFSVVRGEGEGDFGSDLIRVSVIEIPGSARRVPTSQDSGWSVNGNELHFSEIPSFGPEPESHVVMTVNDPSGSSSYEVEIAETAEKALDLCRAYAVRRVHRETELFGVVAGPEVVDSFISEIELNLTVWGQA